VIVVDVVAEICPSQNCIWIWIEEMEYASILRGIYA